MMLGPGASSRATAVRGTGLLENLGRDSGSWMRGGARDEPERCEPDSCDVELAALLGFLLRWYGCSMAVSDAVVSGCGRRGVLEFLGEPSLGEPFQIALRRSNFLDRKGMPALVGVVFDLPSDRGR